MDTLDAELQRILREPDVMGADVDAALSAVQALHGRRTTRRAVARLAAAVVVVVGGAFMFALGDDAQSGPFPIVETPNSVDLTGAIPWSDRQDFENWAPPVDNTSRPDAAPCLATDLELIGAEMQGAGGHSGTWVRFTNISDARCTLKGYPRLTGVEGVLEPEHGTFFPQSRRPATVDPAEAAVVVIETSLACEPQTPLHSLHEVRVLLDDGTSLRTGRDLESSCPIRIGSWYREVFYPTEPPSRFSDLRATIEAPEAVMPGSTLTYVVTLRNVGATTTDLSPCPGFIQSLAPLDKASLGAGKTFSGGSWRLSCDGFEELGPGEALRFEMRIDVPELAASTESVLLWWQMRDDMPDYAAQAWIPVVP